MIKIKFLLVLLVLALLTAACGEQKTSPPAAAVTDNEANRTAEAKKYLEVVPSTDLLTEMSDKVMKMLPEKQQKIFLQVMGSKQIQEATQRITQKALVKHFTVKELQALTAFYSSPEGKTIRRKFTAYMGDIMPQVSREVVTALQKVEAEEKEKEKKEPKAQPQKPEEKKSPEPKAQKPNPEKPQTQKPKPAEPTAPKK